MNIQGLNHIYILLLCFGIINMLCASQQREQGCINLTIDTHQSADRCSGSQNLSRNFFNAVDMLSLRVLHDDHLTKDDFIVEYQLLKVQYKKIKPELSDQAKKHAESSLESLKRLLQTFE